MNDDDVGLIEELEKVIEESNIQIVAAMNNKGVIGYNNTIPWRVEGEQRNFKKITDGSALIMGRKTFESIGKPLPGRLNIVVTRNKEYLPDGVVVAYSLEQAILVANRFSKTISIIGGAEIYKKAMQYAKTIHLSIIDDNSDGDAFFPAISDDWKIMSQEQVKSNIDYKKLVLVLYTK